MNAASNVVPILRDGEGIVADDLPNVAPGVYSVAYINHATVNAFHRPKVYVRFRIVEGPSTGVVLTRMYRVSAITGKPRRFGRFKASRGGDLFRDWVRLTEGRARPDRIALTALRNCVVSARVRTVTVDYQQRPLPAGCQYAVIGELLEIVAGHLQ